ncbi:helix-turn-helix domain-containing protein [Niabella insulamsoli]|uniref:helix-turn-helix domain-containing protein n=1 Tax=Niabella insulamsoli TaxID=3144874 RepID=UPI003D0D8B7A
MIEQINRDFKGIWIPKEIWLHPDLATMEKLFLVEINSLDNEDGCFASNDYFSRFFGLSKPRCSQIIQSLKEKGFLTIEYTYEGKEITRRTLRLGVKYFKGGAKYSKGGIKKTKSGCLENLKDNNTVFNNTDNNTINDKGSAGTSSEKKVTDKLFYNALVSVWYNHHPQWQFEPKDGTGLKGIVKKICKWQQDSEKEATPETTAAAFDFILSHPAIKNNNFLSTADPSTLNSKLNSVYEQIKNNPNGTKQFIGNSRTSEYASNPFEC